MELEYTDIMQQAKEHVFKDGKLLERPEDVADLMRPVTHALEQEVMFILILDSRNAIIEIIELTKGLINKTTVHAREVFREAIVRNAVRIIMCHNHPSSGDPAPSQGDINATQELEKAGTILGIQILDHVIIGRKTENRRQDWLSMKENNLMLKNELYTNKGLEL